MKLIYRLFLSISNLPFRLKGGKIGRNSYLSPGYDIFNIKLKGITLGDNVLIGRNAVIGIVKNNAKINIGSGTNIGRFSNISSAKNIVIGKKCLISYSVSILDHDHVLNKKNISPIDSGVTKGKNIIIGNNCFIGAHSFILKGVTLGQQCVVGANSVVTRSFPEYSIIAGNPAKLIKKIK